MDRKDDNDITELTNVTCDVTCEKCQEKDMQKIAKAFCVQCQEFMCFQCSENHFTSKFKKHHRVLRKNEMPLRKSSTSVSELCSLHNGAICYFYCQTHGVLMCYICRDSSHKKCAKGSFVSELSHCIEKTEKYQETRAELRNMIQLYRNLQTQLRLEFQSKRDHLQRICQEQHTFEYENEEVQENSQVECAEEVTSEMEKTTRIIQSSDHGIRLAEKLDTDFNDLEKSQQEVQLFITMKMAERTIEHMKSINSNIDKKTIKDTTVVCIQGPQQIVSNTMRVFNWCLSIIGLIYLFLVASFCRHFYND